MQEPYELRPAPRRTPSAVLWMMAVVMLGGSLLLVSALSTQPSQPLGAMASAARYGPRAVPAQMPTTAASATPPQTSLGRSRLP